MKTIKNITNFRNAAVFYDYKNIGNIEELNHVDRCVIENCHDSISVNRILITLSLIDIVILKINDKDIEIVVENIDDLRANFLHMVGFENVVENDV